jgi:hypothetical protein
MNLSNEELLVAVARLAEGDVSPTEGSEGSERDDSHASDESHEGNEES